MTVSAIILAAGESRRFGRPKQLAEYDGRPLICHAVRTVRRAGFEPTVVLGAHRERVESVLDSACRRVHAEEWSEGMGASMRRGVRVASIGESGQLLVTTCDQPLVTPEDLRRLVDATRGADAAAARYDSVRGVPACFDACCRDALLELEGDRGARSILRDEKREIRDVPMPHAAHDVDEPADLEQLRRRSNRRRGGPR